MIFLLALIPATALTVAGYVALFLSHRSEGSLRTFGRYLGIWAFILAGLVALGGMFAAGHMHHMHAHQRGQADRRAHIVGEDQEGRAVRHEAAMHGEPVGDRAHCVFAHAEVQVATGIAPAGAVGTLRVLPRRCWWIEITQPFQVGVRG